MNSDAAQLLTVAMDLQGPKVALPWIKKADAAYPALIDQSNTLGKKYNFNYVPLIILFDEQGKPVHGPAGFDIQKEPNAEDLRAWLNNNKDFEKSSDNTNEMVAEVTESNLRFQYGRYLIDIGKKERALSQLRQALALDEDNWLIRKQIWAIEHPEKFYNGNVDFDWQREQLQQEKSENGD
jgi:excinuclease UvrABC nuclease subunit